MKERPIIFSAPMVRALLNGTKSQTRRVVKFQKEPTTYPETDGIKFVQIGGKQYWWNSQPDHPAHVTKACPYGQPGDRLWVRESWRVRGGREFEYQQDRSQVMYRATHYEDGFPLGWESYKWRPSIHMPRWASRILLEITAVRVERLADISKDDAMAEGIVLQPDGGFGLADSTHYNFSDPTDSYCSLWESINGDGAWFANPWVWVVEFQRAEGGA